MNIYSGVQTIKGKKAIWLQNVGFVNAKKITEFKKGDILAYNHGHTGKVVSVKKISPKSCTLTTIENGKKYKSRVKCDSYKPYYKKEIKF